MQANRYEEDKGSNGKCIFRPVQELCYLIREEFVYLLVSSWIPLYMVKDIPCLNENL